MRAAWVAALIAVTLAGCAGTLGDQASSGAQSASMSMPGRWVLTAPNAPICGMNFTAAVGAQQGSVVPEGGCPEKLYMSRRWTLDGAALTINDEDNQSLARFTFIDSRLQGQTSAGTSITLTRDIISAQ
jgi:hypothetical protein